MRNAGEPQFNYETFIKMVERIPRLKTVITDYNADEVIFKKPEEAPKEPTSQETDVVGDMAKNAIDLGAKL